MGRPVVDSKPRDQFLKIRIDEDRKEFLEQEKKRTGKTMSQIIIELIDNAR